MPANEVVQTITDGALGNVTVPPSSAQAVIGCSSAGTAQQIVSTTSKATLVSTFGYGPLVEAAAMVIDAGGTPICVKTASTTAGSVVKKAAGTVTGATTATPVVITQTAHGYATGDIVVIASVGGNTGANGTFPIIVLTANTYSLTGSVGAGAYTSGGTATPTGGHFVGTGTSAITLTGTPYDDYWLSVKVALGGTIATGPISIQISGDAGRTYGPAIALGTATTYVIPQTGETLNFAAGTLVTGDVFSAQTSAPVWADSDVSSALVLLGNSTYQWGGGIHVVGKSAGSDATAFDGYLATLAAAYRYTWALLDTRDVGLADANEAAWITSLLSDYAAVTSVRVLASAGWYNMPSSVINQTLGGLPRYRRPQSWAAARRVVTVPPQVLLSRVSDGPLAGIVVNPPVDATDGFVYHDERINGGLGPSGSNTGRFMTCRTRVGSNVQGAFYVDQPALMCAAGSDFTLLPYRQVIDIACGLGHQYLENYVDSSVLVNPNGTIFETSAREIESAVASGLNANMTAKGYCSSLSFKVSRTDNIASTKIMNTTTRIVALGYILEIDNSIGFQSPSQVVGS